MGERDGRRFVGRSRELGRRRAAGRRRGDVQLDGPDEPHRGDGRGRDSADGPEHPRRDSAARQQRVRLQRHDVRLLRPRDDDRRARELRLPREHARVRGAACAFGDGRARRPSRPPVPDGRPDPRGRRLGARQERRRLRRGAGGPCAGRDHTGRRHPSERARRDGPRTDARRDGDGARRRPRGGLSGPVPARRQRARDGPGRPRHRLRDPPRRPLEPGERLGGRHARGNLPVYRLRQLRVRARARRGRGVAARAGEGPPSARALRDGHEQRARRPLRPPRPGRARRDGERRLGDLRRHCEEHDARRRAADVCGRGHGLSRHPRRGRDAGACRRRHVRLRIGFEQRPGDARRLFGHGGGRGGVLRGERTPRARGRRGARRAVARRLRGSGRVGRAGRRAAQPLPGPLRGRQPPSARQRRYRPLPRAVARAGGEDVQLREVLSRRGVAHARRRGDPLRVRRRGDGRAAGRRARGRVA